MPSRDVRAPDGHVWVVRRRWVARYGVEPWWAHLRDRLERRARRRSGLGDDLSSIGANDLTDLVLVALGTVAIIVFVTVVWPLLFVLLDLIVLILLALGGAVTRVLLRRPWAVDAVPDIGDALRWRVVGWRRSGRLRDEIADAIERGLPVPGGAFAGMPRSGDDTDGRRRGDEPAGPFR